MVMIDFPSVKLQDQTIGAPFAGVKVRIPEPFVLGSPMTTDAREKSLVPAARDLNIAAVDERLGAHERSIQHLDTAVCEALERQLSHEHNAVTVFRQWARQAT